MERGILNVSIRLFSFRLAQSVKLMIAIAIFLTYALQFYVPMEVIWKNVRGNFSADNKNAAEYTIRVLLVVRSPCKYLYNLIDSAEFYFTEINSLSI